MGGRKRIIQKEKERRNIMRKKEKQRKTDNANGIYTNKEIKK